jgi:uncharacterized membrane protein
MNLKPVLQHVGVLRNQLLVFVILGVVILNLAAYSLRSETDDWVKICRVAMHFLALVIFVGSLVFYCWLLVRLPGTAMEREFSKGARAALKEHRQQRKRRQSCTSKNK